MFRPCLAIFRSQCWCVQMRKNTTVCHWWRPHQTEFYTSAAHRSPHRWNLTHTGLLLPKPQQRTSPTYSGVFYHLYTSTLWPEDGQAWPKHVVTIAAINRITRQLCFWRTLLPSFNISKHNGDDEPEDYMFFWIFMWPFKSFLL
jgi:hypothetical protein